ncbi:MAG: tetratricopeptide repeat protein [Chloroflexota bacterium]
MYRDQHGNEMAAACRPAVDSYDQAIDALLHFREAAAEATGKAIAEDPACPMARVLQAYLGLLTTEAADAAEARGQFRAFRETLDATTPLPREQGHVRAVELWLDGNMSAAGETLRGIAQEFPRDALALAVGHQIDFFTGAASSLRDRLGGALCAWTEADPHFGPMLGMYAFGLEEAGHYDRSEAVGLRAVELDGKDVWGIHAVIHTYEMQGRFGTGTRYYDDRREDWAAGNFLNVHNWWHYALFGLEAGNWDRAIEIYDATLHHEGSAGLSMEMLDAASLLWRFYLEDIEQTDRWNTLARAWQPRVETAHYAFNDMHAVMAYVGSGQLDRAEQLIAARERWIGESHPGVTNQEMTARVGLPVCRALLAFGRGRYGETVDLLYPIRYRINEVGGSHAQRDAVYKTLLEAALRGGRDVVARTLVSERISLRPDSPYNRLKQSQLALSHRGAPTTVAANQAIDT